MNSTYSYDLLIGLDRSDAKADLHLINTRIGQHPSLSLTTLRQGIAERCKKVAGGRSEAEPPCGSPSKKGKHPEGVPQRVHARHTRPNLQAQAFREPTLVAQACRLLYRRLSVCWLRSRGFMVPIRVRIWRSGLPINLPSHQELRSILPHPTDSFAT